MNKSVSEIGGSGGGGGLEAGGGSWLLGARSAHSQSSDHEEGRKQRRDPVLGCASPHFDCHLCAERSKERREQLAAGARRQALSWRRRATHFLESHLACCFLGARQPIQGAARLSLASLSRRRRPNLEFAWRCAAPPVSQAPRALQRKAAPRPSHGAAGAPPLEPAGEGAPGPGGARRAGGELACRGAPRGRLPRGAPRGSRAGARSRRAPLRQLAHLARQAAL